MKNLYVDCLGIDASILKNKKLFLFDMDGTIYKDEVLFDGTKQLLMAIRRRGGQFVFITNNSSKSVDEYVNSLLKLDISVGEENFFTSTQATILYIKAQYPNAVVYCQGTRSFTQELRNSGINITEEVSDMANVILVGFDTELTSDKIKKTCEMLQKNLPYIATNPDLVCPVSFGFIPDCGSICMMYENATKRKPIYIGKPEPVMIDTVRREFNMEREQTVVIGDRLYTDIASGNNAGVTSVCVLTGEATLEEIKNSPIKPTYTFYSVKNIADMLAE